MTFWTEAPECMARNFGFCSSTASLTNFTGRVSELKDVESHNLLCFQGRHGMLDDAGTTSNVNIHNINAFWTSTRCLVSWSTAGRSSALVELSLVVPCHATKEPFTAWGTFHVTSTVYSGIIRDPWPPTQSFWTFSRPSLLPQAAICHVCIMNGNIR